jgi:hypothetical protein
MLCAKMVHADSFISRSSMLLLTFFLGLMLGYSTMLFLKSAKIQDSGYIIHAWASACSVAKFVRYRTPKEATADGDRVYRGRLAGRSMPSFFMRW